MYFFDRRWDRPVFNGLKFGGVHSNFSVAKDKTEKVYFRDSKLAFLEFKVKIEFLHSLENPFGLLSMNFWIRGGDEKIVHVNDKPAFSDHVSEGVIHESLEGGGRIRETEKHNSWFEETLVGDECCLP